MSIYFPMHLRVCLLQKPDTKISTKDTQKIFTKKEETNGSFSHNFQLVIFFFTSPAASIDTNGGSRYS